MDRDLTAQEIAMLRQQLEMERERKLRLEQEAQQDQLRLEIAQRNDQRMREYERLFRAEQERQEAERLEGMRLMEEERLKEKKRMEEMREEESRKAEEEKIRKEEEAKRKEVEIIKMQEEQEKRQQQLKDMIAKKAELIKKTSENIRKREEAKAFEVEMKKAEAARKLEEQRKQASKDYELEMKKAEALKAMEEQRIKEEEEKQKEEEEKKKEEEEKARAAMKERLLQMVRQQREKLKQEVENDANRLQRWKTLNEQRVTVETPKEMTTDIKVLDLKAVQEADKADKATKRPADSTSGEVKMRNTLAESFKRSLKQRDKDSRNYRDRRKSPPASHSPPRSATSKRERSKSRERRRGRSRSRERRSRSRERRSRSRERRSRSRERRRGRSRSRDRKKSPSPARDRNHSRRKRSRSGSKSRDKRRDSPGKAKKRSRSRSPAHQSQKRSRHSPSRGRSRSPHRHSSRGHSTTTESKSKRGDDRKSRSKSPKTRHESGSESSGNVPNKSTALSLIQSYDTVGNVEVSDDLLANVSSALQNIPQPIVLEFDIGMQCPLPACVNQPRMYKQDQLITHWNEFHSIRTTSYLCRVCQIHRHQSWETRSRGQIFRHFFTEHPVAVEGHTVDNLPMMHIAVIKEQNLAYIDPGLYELHSSMRSPEDDPLPAPSLPMPTPLPQPHPAYSVTSEDNRSVRSTSIGHQGERSHSHRSRSRSPSRTRSLRSRSRSHSPVKRERSSSGRRSPTERKIEVRFRPNLKCPAEGCRASSRGAFLKLGNFMKHWVTIHFPMNYYKICLLCEERGSVKQVKRVRDLIRHFHREHHSWEGPFRYRSELKYNESFVHPGRFFITQQLLEQAREEASAYKNEMDLEETGPFPTDEEMRKAKEPREIREICRQEKPEILVYGKSKAGEDPRQSDEGKDWLEEPEYERQKRLPHPDDHRGRSPPRRSPPRRSPPRDVPYDHDREGYGQRPPEYEREQRDYHHPADWQRRGLDREPWPYEDRGRGYPDHPEYRDREYHRGPSPDKRYPGPSGPPDNYYSRQGPPDDHYGHQRRGYYDDWRREHSPGYRDPPGDWDRGHARERDQWEDRREWEEREHWEGRQRRESWEDRDSYRDDHHDDHDWERRDRDERRETENGSDHEGRERMQKLADQTKTEDNSNENKNKPSEDREADSAPQDSSKTGKLPAPSDGTGQPGKVANDKAAQEATEMKPQQGPPSQEPGANSTTQSEPPSDGSNTDDTPKIIVIKYFKNMVCPVAECKRTSDVRYNVRAQFMYHWSLHHRKECTYYSCQVCAMQGYRPQRTHQLDEMKRHFMRSHPELRWVPPTPNNMQQVFAERKPTEEYIDPGIYRF